MTAPFASTAAEGGQEAGPAVQTSFPSQVLTSLPAWPHKESFRLREHVGTGGIRVYPKIFDTVIDALDRAELILAALVSKPHRRPYLIQVIDAWTGEIVTSLRPGEERDPDLCPVCKQPNDPFAKGPPMTDTEPTEEEATPEEEAPAEETAAEPDTEAAPDGE